MASKETFIPPNPPIGIIESLSSGFEVVASHLPLVILPIAVDTCLWLGPRLLIREMNFGALAQLFKAFQQLPDLYLPVFFLPSLIGLREAKPLPFNYTPEVYEILRPEEYYGAFGIAILLGYVVWMIYAGMIGQLVADGLVRPVEMGRQVFAVSLQIAIVFALAILLISVALLPIQIILSTSMLEAGNYLMLIVVLLVSGILGAFVVFFVFTPHSMFMNRRNLIAAMFDSMQVVQWNLAPTLGLLALIGLIGMAMHQVWMYADPGSWVIMIAICGNAFINTGLVAATFVYFKDRHRYWRELRDALIAEFERRRARQQQES